MPRRPDLWTAEDRRHNGRVRSALADDIEELVRQGTIWEPVALAAAVDRLEAQGRAGGDPIVALLAQPLRSVLLRLQIGPVVPRTAADIEAIVYPRLWKVMEAIRDDLPDGELRTRIEGLNRRLAQRFAQESMAEIRP